MMRHLLAVLVVAGALCCAAAERPPKLFAGDEDFKALQERAKQDELCRLGCDRIIKNATTLLTVEPVERKLEGRRLLYVSMEAVRRMGYLSLAFRLTDEQKFLDRAVKEMRAIAAFSDWHPEHFLDTAEMTLALAIGHNWLYDSLSAEDRALIEEAIVRKGLEVSFRENYFWMRHDNNWTQVCHASLIAGAITVGHRPAHQELSQKVIKRGAENILYSMKMYAPDGAYPEGPGYWNYGTSFNVLAIAALEGAFGKDYGLLESPGFTGTLEYINYATGPSGQLFNYCDCCRTRGNAVSVWWLANRLKRPELAQQEVPFFKRLAEGDTSLDSDTLNVTRLFPLSVLWYRPTPPQAINLPLCKQFKGRTPIAVQRNGWGAQDAYFAIKGGDVSVGHGHMDIGTFVYEALGERWAVDLGRVYYTTAEAMKIDGRTANVWGMGPDSDRWKFFRMGEHGHNVLRIGGIPQDVKATSKILSAETAADGSSTVTVDLSNIYTAAEKVTRTSRLQPSGAVTITDTITAKPGTSVRWQMLTRAQVIENKDGTLRLRQNGRELTLTSKDAAWKVLEENQLHAAWDPPDDGIRLLYFDVTIPDTGFTMLSAELHPQ